MKINKLPIHLCLIALALSCVTGLAEAPDLFPLAEPVTIELVVATGSDVNDLEKSPYYQALVQATGVSLKLVSLGSGADYGAAQTKLHLLFNSGDYGEGIWGGSLIAEADLIALAEAGILAPMNRYIEDPAIMPNFNNRVLSESPQTKAYITALDGGIYALPGYNNNPGNYIESPITVNKLWLEQLNLEVPATLEEFKAMLIAFRDGDPNQNGLQDEIPYLFMTGDAFRHPEALMHYMDLFYSWEGYEGLYYGLASEGRFAYDEEGFFADLQAQMSDDEKAALNADSPVMTAFVSDPQFVITGADYGTVVRVSESLATAWSMYDGAGIINKEIWPRPFFTADDAARLGELRTDIFNTVTEMRAKWITGRADIDADWDDYVNQLHAMGLAEMVELLQKAYDQYLSGM